MLLPAAVFLAICGCAGSTQSVVAKAGGELAAAPKEAAKGWESNGIRVVRVGRAMNGMMLDLRYRITDLAQAQKVLTRQANMVLIDQQSGRVLAVPNTAKVGKLRQIPNEATKDRLFWAFFNNSDLRVKRGDKVTWKVDGVAIEDIVVE